MYAVVETAGKQYRVEPGMVIMVDPLEAEVGSVVTLDRVLMVSSDETAQVGTPHLESAKVVAEVKQHGLSPKLKVIKKKRRKNYRRSIGHRQPHTLLEVKEIVS